jgi:hypothetical protein
VGATGQAWVLPARDDAYVGHKCKAL